MKLPKTFFKLPFRFDVERLKAETEQFAEGDWSPHPQGFAGNSSLILVSVDGEKNDDFAGAMHPTPLLGRCPYFQQVMNCFNTVVGRSRLMRLATGAEVTAHYDLHYNWYQRVRIHVPIVTDPGVRFLCGDDEVHMQPGEAWIFDTWQFHNVINGGDVDRVHLVIDTAGTAAFWDLLARSWTLDDPEERREASAAFVPYREGESPTLRFERWNANAIDPPAVMDHKMSELRRELGRFAADRPERFAEVEAALVALAHDWRCLWYEHGETGSGVEQFRSVIDRAAARCWPLLAGVVIDSNGAAAHTLLGNWLGSAINTQLIGKTAAAPVQQLQPAAPAPRPAVPVAPAMPRPMVAAAGAPLSGLTLGQGRAAAAGPQGVRVVAPFQRPICLVAAPRSGSTMLFEALCNNPAVWSTGGESHETIESIPELGIASHGFESNVLTAADATPEVSSRLRVAFIGKFRDANGGTMPQTLRFLEKTPKNSLRIPFLREVFPDAIFIHLHRDPRPSLGSIMEAWQSGRFVTYPTLPGWNGPPWSLLLPPWWRSLTGKPLAEIAAYQWAKANETILDDLADLPESRRCAVRYEDLLADRAGELERLCSFAGIPFGPRMQQLCAGDLPLSRYTVSKPDAEKWRRHEAEIEAVMPGLAGIVERLQPIAAM